MYIVTVHTGVASIYWNKPIISTIYFNKETCPSVYLQFLLLHKLYKKYFYVNSFTWLSMFSKRFNKYLEVIIKFDLALSKFLLASNPG